MTAGNTLTPARLLPAQAHAPRAAAVFIERAGTAGLPVTVDASAFITVHVPDDLGEAIARAALATAAGGRIVGSIALGSAGRYRITGYGQPARHPVTITTPPAESR